MLRLKLPISARLLYYELFKLHYVKIKTREYKAYLSQLLKFKLHYVKIKTCLCLALIIQIK